MDPKLLSLQQQMANGAGLIRPPNPMQQDPRMADPRLGAIRDPNAAPMQPRPVNPLQQGPATDMDRRMSGLDPGAAIDQRVASAHNPPVGPPQPGLENQSWESIVAQGQQQELLRQQLAKLMMQRQQPQGGGW